ncbi:MAG: hypothetical protein P4M08_05500 [Oligoflexia bacterium]|nr:hypothetical protein [Oligoflexia bacterium]
MAKHYEIRSLFKFILMQFLFACASCVSWAGSPVSINGTIGQIANGWDGQGYILVLYSPSAPTGCSMANNFYIPKSAPYYQEAVANAMLAFTTKSNVTVVTDGTCDGSRANVIAVQLFQ